MTNKAFSWKLPGGSGLAGLIIAHSGRQGISNFPHSSRVSCSELFGGLARMVPQKL